MNDRPYLRIRIPLVSDVTDSPDSTRRPVPVTRVPIPCDDVNQRFTVDTVCQVGVLVYDLNDDSAT